MPGHLPKVAFFSMEFALDSRFRIYAGGLGIHAGNVLKEAADQDLPIVGIGIRWRQGCGKQRIEKDGDRICTTYLSEAHEFLKETGVIVQAAIKGRNVRIKVWKVDVFGVDSLYLLDTDLEGNDEDSRWITGRIYGGSSEERVAQEMVLGIGGVRALRALNLEPEVYHFNESHALFAGFELIGSHMAKGLDFNNAWFEARRRIVFTTHTASIQASETHPIERLLYLGANLRLSRAQVKRIGGDPFDMTIASLRLSRLSNAVTKRHRTTAERLWHYVKERSEIIDITSGVHPGTWTDLRMVELAEACRSDPKAAKALWNRHLEHKRALIRFVAHRSGVRLQESPLLMGFVRWALPGMRPGFPFLDEAFLEPMLERGKLQIIMAGKSHPQDEAGSALLEDLLKKARRHPGQIAFLEDCDLETGQQLSLGLDLWLNTSRGPMEASGTVGMKAAMNGVLTLSVLDGWWPEVCRHGLNGWQFGNGFESDEDHLQEQHDVQAFKRVLSKDVVPTFHDRPAEWIRMMAESIRATRPFLEAKRMLHEYFARLYSPEEWIDAP